MVLINASDLNGGVRFSFIQGYFDLLCSDINSFPVARAVTASSAVPVLFDPVVLENYKGCSLSEAKWLEKAQQQVEGNPELMVVIEGLQSYADKERRRYIHFVDGGITDNLGLRAITEVMEVSGGAKAVVKKLRTSVPRYLVVLVVNAATKSITHMDQSKAPPSLKEVLSAVTDTQLHLYNAATLRVMQQDLEKWAEELSTPEHPVTPILINVSLKELSNPEQQRYFNEVPTSFSLTDAQVDALVAIGRNLLIENPEYRSLVEKLDGTLPRPRPLILKTEEKKEQPALIDL